MEQINTSEGGPNAITEQNAATQADHGPRTYLTFAEAESHNAYGLLTELYEHTMTDDLQGQPPEYHLTELSLMAAVVAWWSRWQPITMHRALVAGAGLADVAIAAGTTEAEAYHRWSAWADVQSKLVIAGRTGVDAADVAAIRARVGEQISS
jgi:hypothetical protein